LWPQAQRLPSFFAARLKSCPQAIFAAAGVAGLGVLEPQPTTAMVAHTMASRPQSALSLMLIPPVGHGKPSGRTRLPAFDVGDLATPAVPSVIDAGLFNLRVPRPRVTSPL
jgi:hypothetical protein